MNTRIKPTIWLSLGMIVFSIAFRIFGSIPNFSPVMAVSLFAGLTLTNKKLAFIFPLSIMIVSDVILALTQTWTTFWGYLSFQPIVYGTFLLVVLIGTLIKKKNFLTIGSSVIGSSLLFFIITNFFVWVDFQGWGMYPHTLEGLIQCYVAAIPFYRFSIISDVLFSGVLYGIFYGISLNVPMFKKALQEA